MSDNGSARVEIIYRPGDPQSPQLRLRVGHEVSITLYGSPAYGWTPVEVVPGPMTLIETEAVAGTARAAVRATAPGEAELRSTSSFHGDRFGPQTRLWPLLVHIDP
ncbi:hypothetical protein [Streptomyces sp. NPDC001410]|uniref:hypothetical protein n=1 Tax=Streptomyces sp. NPDC001410 TaxID=3364574 RepID=UPI0036C0F6D2